MSEGKYGSLCVDVVVGVCESKDKYVNLWCVMSKIYIYQIVKDVFLEVVCLEIY